MTTPDEQAQMTFDQLRQALETGPVCVEFPSADAAETPVMMYAEWAQLKLLRRPGVSKRDNVLARMLARLAPRPIDEPDAAEDYALVRLALKGEQAKLIGRMVGGHKQT